MTTTETDKETATEMKNAKDDKDRAGEREKDRDKPSNCANTCTQAREIGG